jgi:signal transduction histidine kinase
MDAYHLADYPARRQGQVNPLRARRLAWTLWAAASVVQSLGLILWAVERFSSATPVLFSYSKETTLNSLAFATLGALVASQQSKNPVGWIFCALGLASGLQMLTGQYAMSGIAGRTAQSASSGAAGLASEVAQLITVYGLIFIALPFPSGRLLSHRWRIVAWTVGASFVLVTTGRMLSPGPLADFGADTNPLGVRGMASFLHGVSALGSAAAIVALIGSISSLLVRYRRSRGLVRLQLKWFTFAVVLAPVTIFGFGFVLGLFPNPVARASSKWVWAVAVVTIPISAGVSILRYRLYDIDVVINKTLVYGALATFVTAVYVAVVAGLGALVGTSGKPNLGLSLAATAIVAVAFQPVRSRVQAVANRLVYGERVTPYEAISGFSRRVAESLSVDQLLPGMAEAAARGVGGVRSRVRLLVPGGGEVAVGWPAGPTEGSFDRTVAVVHQGETVGEISVAKAPGETVSPVEQKLLADLASQAGLAMRNIRLTTELRQHLLMLQASRERIVEAQDQERRRIERDIHDGAQQQLVSMAVKLGLAERLLAKDPDRTAAMIAQVKAETHEALETLRDLARGLFPRVIVKSCGSTFLTTRRPPRQPAQPASRLRTLRLRPPPPRGAVR